MLATLGSMTGRYVDSLGAHVAIYCYGTVRINLISDKEVSIEVDAPTGLDRAMDI